MARTDITHTVWKNTAAFMAFAPSAYDALDVPKVTWDADVKRAYLRWRMAFTSPHLS